MLQSYEIRVSFPVVGGALGRRNTESHACYAASFAEAAQEAERLASKQPGGRVEMVEAHEHACDRLAYLADLDTKKIYHFADRSEALTFEAAARRIIDVISITVDTHDGEDGPSRVIVVAA